MGDLSKETGRPECTGFEALYLAALDSDVELITAVPGYPITSLMELFLENAHFDARWLTNEKVALEIALGASSSGRRSLVVVKHVGMNLLSDPLITSVTHSIGAGLVIIAGDDPGIKGSQNEQDSRWYGKIAEVAVFDPQNPETAYRALREAYELSEKTKTPVIVRLTAGLDKIKGELKRLPASAKPHPEFDRSIWNIRMREKHQRFHKEVYPLLEEEAETTELNILKKGKRKEKEAGKLSEKTGMGIISSGFASTLVEEVLGKSNKGKTANKGNAVSQDTFSQNTFSQNTVSHLSLNLVNPLPLRKIGAFLEENDRVLVVEESEPVIEDQLRIAGKVYGKNTGHVPYGQVLAEDIEFALEHIGKDKPSKPEEADLSETRKQSRTSICEDCPYLPLYRFLRSLDVRVAGDMGCSIRSAPEPLAAVDVSFALGSAISVACGFEKKGIAVIGDFALAHSGILGLLTAVNSGYDVLALVLLNEVAAMTGGQEVPDLTKVVEAIVPDVSLIDLDGKNGENERGDESENKTGPEKVNENESPESELSNLISEKLALPGVSVIFVKGKCTKY
ncbi:thiamine pyrophosphate-dependent enzyme [Methanosarcina sp. Mfa9]|uniref:thiamine pyrophosphate-dependent enzyme n=1 Tax=Methanosarcina sp. Mfa9 TaxID=3439063 RepID=UPI003F84D961